MSAKEIVDSAFNDTRSKEEVFKDLKQQIQEDYNGTLSEKEAVAATHRLIRFFQILFDGCEDKQRKKLENQDEKA